MLVGEIIKLKFRASVEYVSKMDLPRDQWGDHVILEMNGNEVYRWKLTGLDALNIFNIRRDYYSTDQGWRDQRTVNEDGLSEFVAGKFSEVFGLAFAVEQS